MNDVTGGFLMLGSVRVNSNGERISYYPYGEERTATTDGREKFGTYIRDFGGMQNHPNLLHSALHQRPRLLLT